MPRPVLDYKKRNDHKIFHLSTKLIASNSDIDEAFNPCIRDYDKNKKILLVKMRCNYKAQY